MWHLPDNPGSYVIDRRRRSIDLANLEIAPIASVAEYSASKHLTIWIGEFKRTVSIPKSFSVDGQGFRRLLDHFHIPTVPDTDLSVALFDLCAQAYDRIVDVNRNISNINNLLRVALSAGNGRSGPFRILDFGCGTGLAAIALQRFVPTNSNCTIQLTGTDRSPHMLEMATRRGLFVLTETEWSCIPAGSFDAVIASYVMHLGFLYSDCDLIFKQLSPGGVFVANYHGGEVGEIARMVALLKKAGLRALPLPNCDAGEPRNPTILFGRPWT